jgi:hypothetical protein|mmetsp:Transcript_20632/g.68152  ORF Transcript_20632/g.68152 Transcript_20632/m.68152 type:complete len:89 (-) Transcript_20632:2245-2511(-)
MALSLVTAQRALELLASPKKPVAIVNSRHLSLGYGCPSAIISVESLPALSCKAASAFDDFALAVQEKDNAPSEEEATYDRSCSSCDPT